MCNDGTQEVVEAGQAYVLRPGHAFVVLEQFENVEFTQMNPEYAQVGEAFLKNFPACWRSPRRERSPGCGLAVVPLCQNGHARGVERDTMELRFMEQEDGRKVARLFGGKIVLVEKASEDLVNHGEWWRVELEDRGRLAIATPLERLPGPSESAPPEPASESTRLVSREPTRLVSEGERVALFVHGPRLEFGSRQSGYAIDFTSLLEHFTGPGRRYAAYYHGVERPEDARQASFLDFLAHAGYTIRLKRARGGPDAWRPEVDPEIIVDMLTTASHYDVAFLFAGSSDYECVINALRTQGKRVYVVTTHGNLSREVAHAADKPLHFLEDLRQLAKQDAAR